MFRHKPFTRESQLQDRLGISAPERFLRMETVPSNFQQNMPNIGKKPEMTCLNQGCQISFQVSTLGTRIPKILVQVLFNRTGITRVDMHSLYLP